jgi:hypothetical protein
VSKPMLKTGVEYTTLVENDCENAELKMPRVNTSVKIFFMLFVFIV